MIKNGRSPVEKTEPTASGGRPAGRQGPSARRETSEAARAWSGPAGRRPFEPGQPTLSKSTIIASLGLHLALILFLVFGPPSCQGESGKSAIDPSQVVTVQLMSEPAPPPVPAEPAQETPPDRPAPQPPAFELPLGDSSRNLQRSGRAETETAEEETPPAPPEDLVALGPKAKAPPPELEKRRERQPEVKPPAVKRREEPRPKAKPQEDYSKVPQAIYRMLGRDAGAVNFGSRQGRRVDPVVSRYFELALMKFNENWSPPKGLNPQLVAGIALTIEPNGRISSVRLVKPSGVPEFDRSVERAIKMASPLAPLPPVFGGQRVSQTFGFTPEGLVRRR